MMISAALLVSCFLTQDPVAPVLEVSAGSVAREASPTRARIPRQSWKPGPGQLLLVAGDIERTAQVVAVPTSKDELEIVWIEDALPAESTRQYRLRGIESHQPTFEIQDGDGFRALMYGEQPIYRHEIRFDEDDLETTKKVYTQLFGWHDEGFITKGAGGLHPHHRGVFAGWTAKIGDQTANFWVCNNGATIRHREFLMDFQVAGEVLARDTSRSDWIHADGTTMVRETRRYETWQPTSGLLTLDVWLTLEAGSDQPVTLTGDPHHGGFQVRASQDVAADGGSAKFVRPESASGGGNDIWQDCPWIAMDFTVRGHRYTLLHIDHPSNPRPMVYSTRPYGRTGSFAEATLEPGQPLVMRYRLILFVRSQHESLDATELHRRYQDFVQPANCRLAQGG